MRHVVILGSTGSIGTQALDVIGRNPDAFAVVGLGAGGRDVALVADQASAFGAEVVAITDAAAARTFDSHYAEACARRGVVARAVSVLSGPRAQDELAAWPCEVVLNGLAGAAGLTPTLAALTAGRTLALANKESLIIGGDLVRAVAAPGQIVPVDSEHSALAQALRAGTHGEVRRLLLTASGGPFRGWSADALETVTPEQALQHPTWTMGPLVTINSATLMNKGLEVIEAHLLFGIDFDAIDVVVHPQSIVHSMVEFTDGSTIAQASPPDMRLPIALGLAWPDRIADAIPGCDWSTATRWDFLPLDDQVFPAVSIARTAGRAGGTATAVFNAADEACVAAFLDRTIAFPHIVRTVEAVLDLHLSGGDDRPGSAWVPGNAVTLDDVQAADTWARARALEVATSLAEGVR
ncbi:MAG: 1-deoxy-D-xylulose-5-phosphate reductoisomerase [Candidatus Nanopelagicales bacterium]|nr:1-deoxy-D-xylulose-5-phosphate reductoisomerase [Candidatus Nanopelagicales bacterium]